MKMIKKLLIWLMVIMLCLSVVPSFAEEVNDPEGGENVENLPEEPEEEPVVYGETVILE
jgi:hypothetical protein